MLKRILSYRQGFFQLWEKDLKREYGIDAQDKTIKNVVNIMTNEFPVGSGKRTYEDCVFIKKEDMMINGLKCDLTVLLIDIN